MALLAFIDHEENFFYQDVIFHCLLKRDVFKTLIFRFNDAHCLYGSRCDSRN